MLSPAMRKRRTPTLAPPMMVIATSSSTSVMPRRRVGEAGGGQRMGLEAGHGRAHGAHGADDVFGAAAIAVLPRVDDRDAENLLGAGAGAAEIAQPAPDIQLQVVSPDI